MKISDGKWFALIVAGWVALIGPGTLTGRVFPAIKDTSIIASLPTDARYVKGPGATYYNPDGIFSAVWIKTTKARDCKFLRMEWFYGPRYENRVPLFFDTGPAIIRGSGRFAAGPWVVRVRHSLLSEVPVDVYHQCGVFGFDFPWETRTKFIN